LYYVLAESFPFYDQVIVLVNTDYYGGTGSAGGGTISTIPACDVSGWIALHELGHSFGGLADEYWSGFDQESPNLTQESSISKVRWKNWLGSNEIGIYPIPGSNDKWFRPHQNCLMQVLGTGYCSVCTEAIIEKIHSHVRPVTTVSPPDSSFLTVNDETVKLTLESINPEPNTIRVVWMINDSLLVKNTPEVIMPVELLDDGYFKTIKVEVMDTTRLTRSDFHWNEHLYTYTWFVDGIVTGIEEGETGYTFQVWPNPVDRLLHVSFDVKQASTITVTITDVLGKLILTPVKKNFEAGEHKLEFDIDYRGIIYVKIIGNEGYYVSVKKIISY
jgi:hypothetical protein